MHLDSFYFAGMSDPRRDLGKQFIFRKHLRRSITGRDRGGLAEFAGE